MSPARAELESALARGVQSLHDYELRLLTIIAARLIRGQIAFGPFDKNHRDWAMEAVEEGIDGALYSTRGLKALDLHLQAAVESLKLRDV